MKSLAPPLIGGILLGGIIHVAIIFMVPLYASDDAWSQMNDYGAVLNFHRLPSPAPETEAPGSLDPRMAHAVCSFNLADGPVNISAEFPNGFWSVAIFDRRGRNVYSLNDRTADRSRLELAVITPVQMALLRQDPPALLETAIVVEHPLEEGFALLRVFVPDQGALEAAGAALNAASCGPL